MSRIITIESKSIKFKLLYPKYNFYMTDAEHDNKIQLVLINIELTKTEDTNQSL